MAAESWDGLTVLLKVRELLTELKCLVYMLQVNSKDAVQKVIQEAFRHRNGAGMLVANLYVHTSALYVSARCRVGCSRQNPQHRAPGSP